MATTLGNLRAPNDLDFQFDPRSQDNPGGQIMPTTRELGLNGQATSSGRSDKTDSKQSIQHILTTTEPRPRSQSQTTPIGSAHSGTPTQKPIIWVDERAENSEDPSVRNDSYSRAAEFNPSHTMTVAHTRRNANGTIGSVYSGNKIRHLKKEDGIPLWRKDIQLEFLHCVFYDETPCFTKAFDATRGHTFADIYVDAMARSSKTSKILKEKLLADRANAMTMAMICLLVNIGRMNTTLNFFPEMRAQLRTFHSIPSLQANQDPNAYKQLQDAPRLKSILKGASEDADQPSTIEKIRFIPVPRTNPVNLIFVLSQYAPKISETHFSPPRDFFDLVMRGTLSSRSRAKAFLWLIWFYLESDFSAEDSLNNPFGPGQHGAETGGLPLKVPPFEPLSEEQAEAENVDTPSEKEYGEMKRQERRRILEEDETVGPPLKKMKKNPALDEGGVIAISDTEPTRSPSPSTAVHSKRCIGYDGPNMVMNDATDSGTPPTMGYQSPISKPESSNPQRIVIKSRGAQMPGSSPPVPPGAGNPILHSAISNGYRRSRPETSHQKAVNQNRRMRTDHILHKQLAKRHRSARVSKISATSSFGLMIMNRVRDLPEMYDSDDDASWGPGGLMPYPHEMADDYGEEALRHKKVVDRAARRLYREENGGSIKGLAKRFRKLKRKFGGYDEDDGNPSLKRGMGNGGGGPYRDRSREGETREEGLDDLDLDLLGEGRDEDQDDMDEDSVMGYSMGDDADMTEEDVMT